MKFNLFILFFVALTSSTIAQNQFSVKFEEQSRVILEDKNQYVVLVDRSTKEKLSKTWEKEIESYSKEKTVETEGLGSLHGVVLEKKDNDTLKVNWRVHHLGEHAELRVTFENKDGVITPERPLADQKVKTFLKTYAKDVYAEVLEDEIKELEKQKKDTQSDLDKQYKEQDKIRSDISKTKSEITTINTEIQGLEGAAERKMAEVNQQKILVESEKGEAQKLAKSQVKEFEKEHKSIVSDKEKKHKEVFELETDIRNYESELGMEQQKADQIKAKVEELHGQILAKETELKALKSKK